MERDCNGAMLNPLCIGFLKRRSKVQVILLEVMNQKLQTDLTMTFGLSLVMDSQSEVTKIMVILQKYENEECPILGRTVLCTMVG